MREAMAGVQVELANPNTYDPSRAYVEQHLVPVVAELHRVLTELTAPGSSSAEEWGVDMVPEISTAIFQRLDKRLEETAKHVVFDGSEYLKIPKELLRAKQLKVQLTAVAYAKHDEDPGTVEFRIVRDDGRAITGSYFSTYSSTPETFTRALPFGNADGCVSPEKRTYYIEGCSPFRASIPVCRRFSLSFIYI